MGVEHPLDRRSDRPGRMLILTFCIAPMVVPLVAIGFKLGVSNGSFPWPASPSTLLASASTSVSAPSLGERPSLTHAAPIVFDPPSGPLQALAMTEGLSVLEQSPSTSSVIRGTHVLRNVEARDGLRLSSDAIVIALEGVDPVPEGSECRRLDGIVEPCAQRAQNRLEILTRGRPVTCEIHAGAGGDMRGACRAGKIDLADDLLRNGLALRRSE